MPTCILTLDKILCYMLCALYNPSILNCSLLNSFILCIDEVFKRFHIWKLLELNIVKFAGECFIQFGNFCNSSWKLFAGVYTLFKNECIYLNAQQTDSKPSFKLFLCWELFNQMLSDLYQINIQSFVRALLVQVSFTYKAIEILRERSLL